MFFVVLHFKNTNQTKYFDNDFYVESLMASRVVSFVGGKLKGRKHVQRLGSVGLYLYY